MKSCKGSQIATYLSGILSYSARKRLHEHIFKSRCHILPAIETLETYNTELQDRINRNNIAINYLKRFKTT